VPSPSSKPAPSPSAKVDAARWEEAWTTWGVSQPPPPNFLDQYAIKLPARIQNYTQGAVSDADARLWAEGAARNIGLQRWSLSTLHEGPLLNHAVLEQANLPINVYGDVLTLIPSYRAKGVKSVQVVGFDTWTAVALVIVPDSVIAQYAAPDKPTKYGLLARTLGPSHLVLTYVDGHAEEVAEYAAGAKEDFLWSGSYDPNHILKPMWVEASGWLCTRHANLTAVCGQLGAS